VIDTDLHAEDALAAQPAARTTAPQSTDRGPASTAQGRQSRDRVLAATADLITEVGIGRTRLAEIARRAGMSSGQLMHYFSSKEHILLATLAWYEDKIAAERRAAMLAITDVWGRLERYVDLYLPTDPADLAWILGAEALARAPHDQDVSDFLDRLWLSWHADLAAIVQDGIKDGTVGHQVSPEDFAIGFRALLDGLGLHVRHKHGMPRQRLIELAMNNARAQLAQEHLAAPDSYRSQHASGRDLAGRDFDVAAVGQLSVSSEHYRPGQSAVFYWMDTG
jgi:AcrR family transcriptional regulator